MRIGVLGLGLGGATAAATLSRRGHEVVVFEQAPEIKEVGAGIASWPNSVRLLRRLGISDRLAEIGAVRRQREVLDQHGNWIGDFAGESSDGTPAYFFHRAELLSTISGLVPSDSVRLGRRCEAVEESPTSVRLRFSSGPDEEVDLLVGADGIRSVAQGAVVPPAPPVYSNLVAYRGLVPAEDTDSPILGRGGVWTNREKYFLAFPVSAGRQINFVGVTPTDGLPDESWFAEADKDDLRREFLDWDPVIMSVIDRVAGTFRWGLYFRSPLPRMVSNRIALLGDAAHPMLIHAGQGAGQAIEDAFALAVLLEGAKPEDVPDRLQEYERLRLPRATQVQLASRRNAQFLHHAFPLADGEQRPTGLFDPSWISEYDAEQEALRVDSKL
ncbi:FAD-dependent oxidoreductase [Amycolatopsis pithecellobii]|uniref:NAD(P)-binding protein n=1 Tax=Amycolatopsis pithecellobii TaxID=664692 RepID=A0A6N7YX96_9PSEU|nr:FAD-dependent monooxygenase [Amycolatopsis pithecellobii]MTD56552.1 NAD(P)-binding protein [Amycolatopsis pithecellobii]